MKFSEPALRHLPDQIHPPPAERSDRDFNPPRRQAQAECRCKSRAPGSSDKKCRRFENLRHPGAEDEVRTRDPQLGKLMLYQLSYFRMNLLCKDSCFRPTAKTFSRKERIKRPVTLEGNQNGSRRFRCVIHLPRRHPTNFSIWTRLRTSSVSAFPPTRSWQADLRRNCVKVLRRFKNRLRTEMD